MPVVVVSILFHHKNKIKLRKKIMVCENCGRILVDDELNEGVALK